MLSVIAETRPHERLSSKPIGLVNQGVDNTDSDEVGAWPQAYKNYTLKEIDIGTEQIVEMGVPPFYEGVFANAWPNALEVTKRPAETDAG